MKDNLIEKLAESVNNGRLYSTYKSIYLVEEDYIAKVGKEEYIKNEFKLGKYLYKKEVQVPKIYSLISKASLKSKTHIKDVVWGDNPNKGWYVIMEKINGKEIWKLEGRSKINALDQYKKELKKVINLGIYARDCNWSGNALFREDGKLYLIDFSLWRKGSKSELEFLNEIIKDPAPYH